MEIDSRAALILQFLTEQNKPVSADMIAAHTGLSPRAVHYRIPQIRLFLQEKRVSLVNKPGSGAYIDLPINEKKKLASNLEPVVIFSVPEREYLILMQLFSSSEPIIISYLEYVLAVSRSTVVKDLSRVETWLNDHKLKLARKPNFGFWIEGEEADLRESLMACMLNGSWEFTIQNELMRFCFGDDFHHLGSDLFGSRIAAYFDSIDFPLLNKVLNSVLDIQLTDRAQFHLILRLAILITRLKQGYVVGNIRAGLGDLKLINEYYWAEFIANHISENYGIRPGLEEISHITSFLIDAQANRPIKITNADLENMDGFERELVEAIDSLMCLVSRQLHPSLVIDYELRYNLALHLQYVQERASYGFREDNPVINEIKQEYGRIFQVVEQSIPQSRASKLGLTRDEVGYITIHVAAALERLRYNERNRKTVLIVCNAGIASALLLKSRIMLEFPDIHIERVISFNELLQLKDFRGIDYIISTIALNIKKAPPVLVVNVILKEKDINNLKKALVVERREGTSLPSVMLMDGPRLSVLTDNNLIDLRVKARDWRDAARRAGELLYKNRLVEERYIESMIDVVDQFGPYMVAWPGVALLHSYCGAGAKQLGMSLITLESPVAFGHAEYDPVDIVIALSIPQDHSIPLALDQLSRMLAAEETVARIKTALRRSTVMMLINKYSHQAEMQDQV